MVMLIQDSSICTPGIEKGRIFIGKLIAGERVCNSHEDKAAIIDDFYDNLLEPVQ